MAEPAVRIGDQVAAYRIERLLGRGGMAVVYRAEHTHLQRSVALKIPFAELAADATFRERFIREARAAASIDHPHLVTVFDAGEADGLLYLAMQYVEGEDLRTVVRREDRLDAERACQYIAQIAAALDAAHAGGLVHRDVKPANVLVAGEHCYVTDFGVSKFMDATRQLSLAGQFLGTLEYAAPEQITGGAVDRRTDVYALGCLAFELLTGAVPFVRDNAAAVFYAQVMTPPPRVSARSPELPRAVDEVVARALAKEPSDRPSTAGEFATELYAAVHGSVTVNVQAPPRLELGLPRALLATDSAFVGRGPELARLRDAWDAAAGGACVAVGLAGEGGIGKTRLAGELARAVHGDGALVLYGHCDDGLAMPYQPFVEALRALPRGLGVARVQAELGGLAPELRRLWPELAEFGQPLRFDPESERFALFEAVTALLVLATRERPALVVLDDLHWAAAPTLLLLRHVLTSERPIRALLLGTFRDTEAERGRPLSRLLADLSRRGAGRRVIVGGLDEAAIAELLQVAGVEAAELVRALEAQTGGNPLFVREVIAHLVESGSVQAILDALRSGAEPASFVAPEELREVIAHRVERLSENCQRMLTVAAVAGPAFSAALLEQAHGEDADLLDEIDEAVGAGLLTETGPGALTFTHALVRQTLYERLGSTRRMRLHRRLGEALEALGEPAEEELSRHFALAGGQAFKAADYALLAGLRATERLGFEEAARHYERGLEALGGADEARRCELLLALGDARWGMAEPELARAAYLQAAELADGARLARAALGYSGPHFFLATGPGVELLERALAALGDEDSALRAQLLVCLARTPERTHEALAMARRTGDDGAIANVLTVSRLAHRGPDEPDERHEDALELARIGERAGDARALASAHEFLIQHHLERADIDAAEREFAALQRLAERAPHRYVRWLLALLGSRFALLAGRLDDAEALADEALAHGGGSRAGANQASVLAHALQMLCVRREQGRVAELAESLEALSATWRPGPAFTSALAFAALEAGRPEQARQRLDALAANGFETIPREALWMGSMANLTAVVTAFDDAALAEPLYALLLPYADRVLVLLGTLCVGSASGELGMLASTLGRFDEAAAHFERALQVNAAIRSPLWVARTRVRYARVLVRRGSDAEELLRDARSTGEALGLTALVDEIDGLAHGRTDPKRTSSP